MSNVATASERERVVIDVTGSGKEEKVLVHLDPFSLPMAEFEELEEIRVALMKKRGEKFLPFEEVVREALTLFRKTHSASPLNGITGPFRILPD